MKKLLLTLLALGFAAMSSFAASNKSAGAISFIDRNDAQYSTALAVVERSFFETLKRNDATKNIGDEHLREFAKNMAVLRLSQTVYEATIAKVENRGNSVVITIPAYKGDGAELEKFLRKHTPVDLTDSKSSRRLENQFFDFGGNPQTITVQVGREIDGHKTYDITHETETKSKGPVSIGSSLPDFQLGAYAPFAGFFPKA